MTIRPTRYDELGYVHDENTWRFVDISTHQRVGPQYRTKAELLADLERYAVVFGCSSESTSIGKPE